MNNHIVGIGNSPESSPSSFSTFITASLTINGASLVTVKGALAASLTIFGQGSLTTPNAFLNPTVISNLVSWHDAKFPADITLTSGKVTTWANHSGSGGTSWDLQSDNNTNPVTRRPSFTSGDGYVIFDGNQNEMHCNGTSVAQPASSVYKINILTQLNSALNNNQALSDGYVINTRTSTTAASLNFKLRLYNGAVLDSGNNVWTTGTPFVVCNTLNAGSTFGATGAINIKGNPVITSGLVGNLSTASGLTLGGFDSSNTHSHAAYYWHLIYSKALTLNEQYHLFLMMP